MQIGFFGVNTGLFSDAEGCSRMGKAIEDAGYDSIWTGEHLVLVDPQEPPSPLPPQARMLDQGITLAYLAAQTQRVKLATGIIILPQRNPVVLAKELASLDVLSGGRLIFGVGVGYVKGEYDAIGVPFEERGARASEYIEAIRALWTEPAPKFEGAFTCFSGIQAHPRPLQQPHPPIVVGGTSDAALRRAARQGDGWYGFFMDLETTADTIEKLGRAGRPADRAPLEISVTPPFGELDRDLVRRYEDLGVHRIVAIRPWKEMIAAPDARGAALDAAVDYVRRTAEKLGLG